MPPGFYVVCAAAALIDIAYVTHMHVSLLLGSPFLSLFLVLYLAVQSLIRVHLFASPCTVAHQAFLSFIVSLSLLRLMSIKSVMLSNHLILCYPFLLLPSIFPSIRVFSSESALCIKWSKYWSFSFSISSFNEYSRLISFRIGWFDLLAVHGILKSLPRHHNQNHQFLEVQPSF